MRSPIGSISDNSHLELVQRNTTNQHDEDLKSFNPKQKSPEYVRNNSFSSKDNFRRSAKSSQAYQAFQPLTFKIDLFEEDV